MCIVLSVGRSTIVELVFLKKELSLLGAAPNRQKLEGSKFLKWASIAPTESFVKYLLRNARARPAKSFRAVALPKMSWISVHTNELLALVQFRLSIANVRV